MPRSVDRRISAVCAGDAGAGMKELDVLLARYVEEHYARRVPGAHQEAFLRAAGGAGSRDICLLPGPAQPPTPMLRAVIGRITSPAGGRSSRSRPRERRLKENGPRNGG